MKREGNEGRRTFRVGSVDDGNGAVSYVRVNLGTVVTVCGAILVNFGLLIWNVADYSHRINLNTNEIAEHKERNCHEEACTELEVLRTIASGIKSELARLNDTVQDLK